MTARIMFFSFFLLASNPLLAQEKMPKRPKLDAGMDPNSAVSYYREGLALLERDPKKASEALHWATRIEPSWPEALYARWIAETRANQREMIRYLERDRKTRGSRSVQQRDSLLVRAFAANPFLHRGLDPNLIRHFLRAVVENDLRRRDPSIRLEEFSSEIRFQIEAFLRSDTGLEFRAWMAYGEQRFPQALALYEEALSKDHDDATVHDDRASMYFQMGQFPMAAAELSHALQDLREKDSRDLRTVYLSKAMFAYKLGVSLARAGKLPEAHDALQQALVEDLSFYPAHLMLGNFAIAANDTAEALREYGLAVELAPNAAHARMQYAQLLLDSGDPAKAIEILDPLPKQEPVYALPHRLLGEAAERLEHNEEARRHYADFLALAAANAPDRARVEEHLTAMGGPP